MRECFEESGLFLLQCAHTRRNALFLPWHRPHSHSRRDKLDMRPAGDLREAEKEGEGDVRGSGARRRTRDCPFAPTPVLLRMGLHLREMGFQAHLSTFFPNVQGGLSVIAGQGMRYMEGGEERARSEERGQENRCFLHSP
jgi:hypothetical protein